MAVVFSSYFPFFSLSFKSRLDRVDITTLYRVLIPYTGQGFKLSSVMGELLVELVSEKKETTFSIEPFSFSKIFL